MFSKFLLCHELNPICSYGHFVSERNGAGKSRGKKKYGIVSVLRRYEIGQDFLPGKERI